MRKSFLRIFSLILACIFVVSLVGCQSSSDNDGVFSESSSGLYDPNGDLSEGLESDGITELESSDGVDDSEDADVNDEENDGVNDEENADKNEE